MDLTPQERGVLENLELLLRRGDDMPTATRKLKVMIGRDELVDRIAEIHQDIADQKHHIAQETAIVDPEDFKPWYTGPSPDDVFWPKLKHMLEEDPRWRDAVESLDDASTDVVGLLADPHSPTIATRGLVIGHV